MAAMFDVVAHLRAYAAEVLAEADRVEKERGAETMPDTEPEDRYCGAVQPVPDSSDDEGFACNRPLGHYDERHGYAGVFWTGDARQENARA